ncbi:ParA family protein [Azospirillum argentinense]
MAIKVAFLSQKGGVTKTTKARLFARAFAFNKWRVKICDFDLQQRTASEWGAKRLAAGIRPEIEVQAFAAIEQALEQDSHYDLLIFDGRGFADKLTLDIARVSDAIFLPSGLAVDDLAPTVRLAHELRKAGISTAKIAVVFGRTGSSEVEIAEARDYVAQAGYKVLERTLPEKQGYRAAHDAGKAADEARAPTLRIGAKHLAEEMAAHVTALTEKA